jgi:uridine phosphorylase
MPSRLRPTAPVAAEAILVGDPGRALMLAQELLAQPKMSNHARGLWGYTGGRPDGGELTIQATGMGGPSAALVVADLAKLGVRRVVRVGTCAAFPGRARAGELLLVSEALAAGGSAAAFGVEAGASVHPHSGLFERLREELGGDARVARVASFDAMPAAAAEPQAEAADLQTVAVLARGAELGLEAAAVLVVSEELGGESRLTDEQQEGAAKLAGGAAASVL